MNTGTQPPCKLDVLLTATFFLMTQYTLQGRLAIAQAVVDHLDGLMAFESGLPPRLVLALPRLREQWLEHFAGRGETADRVPSGRCVVIPFRAAMSPKRWAQELSE